MSVRVTVPNFLISCFVAAAVGNAVASESAGDSMPVIDYALAAQRDEWLRHPELGDPSCDNFTRIGGPVVSGKPGLEWPVNGSLTVDPKDGAWYLFAGLYPNGYDIKPPPNHMQCEVHCSRNQGKSWERIGTPWPDAAFRLDGVKAEVTHAPDMAACFADGRWHLVYDWLSADSTWPLVNAPLPTGSGPDSGVGYASAASPAGPWMRSTKPLRLNSQVFRAPLLGKYHRVYASTLLRRKNDWLLLSAMDSMPAHAWALVGATATRPEGPYGEAVPLLHTEDARYMPAILEFFPSFAHDGKAYAPATGLAANRNHQVMFAADLEQAHRPDAWQIEQEGAIWHCADVASEARGLWGQTLGCTVYKGDLLALFPSRDREGLGHLGVAKRPWAQPFRDGVVLSGHESTAPAPLRWSYDAFRLDAALVPRGQVALLWAWSPAIGYNGIGDWKPHTQCVRRCQLLELDDATWRVVTIDGMGARTVIAEGPRQAGAVSVTIDRTTDGTTAITLGDKPLWQGALPAGAGGLGLFAGEWSHLAVDRLAVAGERRPVTAWYLAEDAFHGAGGNPSEWQFVPHAAFHFGNALVHRGDGGRGKWSVRASAVNLWAPRGPDGVAYVVELDGRNVATVECRAAKEVPSAPVWKSGPLPYGPHTVVLRSIRGPLVVDALEAVVR